MEIIPLGWAGKVIIDKEVSRGDGITAKMQIPRQRESSSVLQCSVGIIKGRIVDGVAVGAGAELVIIKLLFG